MSGLSLTIGGQESSKVLGTQRWQICGKSLQLHSMACLERKKLENVVSSK